MAPNEITWLSSREAAEMLGITARTLYRLIDSGQVPAYRMGRVIRLQAAEVEEFIARSRIEPGSLEHLYADVAGGPEQTELVAGEDPAPPAPAPLTPPPDSLLDEHPGDAGEG